MTYVNSSIPGRREGAAVHVLSDPKLCLISYINSSILGEPAGAPPRRLFPAGQKLCLCLISIHLFLAGSGAAQLVISPHSQSYVYI